MFTNQGTTVLFVPDSLKKFKITYFPIDFSFFLKLVSWIVIRPAPKVFTKIKRLGIGHSISYEQIKTNISALGLDRNNHACNTLWWFVTVVGIYRTLWAMGQCRVGPCCLGLLSAYFERLVVCRILLHTGDHSIPWGVRIVATIPKKCLSNTKKINTYILFFRREGIQAMAQTNWKPKRPRK